jgi:hypothetical protein
VEKPNYFAVIPASVRYDDNLKMGEKLMYGEITALTNKTGECWASNNYFAELYKVTPQAISKWIKNLEKNNYIIIAYDKKGKMIEKRIIKMVSTDIDRVSTTVEGGINSSLEGYQPEIKENNTSINNININNKKEVKEKRFIKPTIEEIQAYCDERNNGINANAFYDFYESKNWYVGKNKMKDWNACIRTWEQREKKDTSKKKKWYEEDYWNE